MSALEQLSRTILLCRDYVAEGISDQEILDRFQSVTALCVSDVANLLTHSGQTALVTLVSLLSRMGMQVELRIPEVSMVFEQPPLSGSFLRRALLSSSGSFIEGAHVRPEAGGTPDLLFVIGDTNTAKTGALNWRLIADDWCGAIEHLNVASGGCAGRWPIGAMTCADLAAGEAFKFVMRGLPMRNPNDVEFFQAARSCSWHFGALTVPDGKVNPGEIHLVSAGAICQAALYALLRIPHLELRGTILDDDRTSDSNLNRNMLTLIDDLEVLKVNVVAKHAQNGIRLRGVPTRFNGLDAVENLSGCVFGWR